MDIEFPGWMRPVLRIASALGALVHRQGREVRTEVHKHMHGSQQHWQRFMTYEDGQKLQFHSICDSPKDSTIVEWVNPWLGLQTRLHVANSRLFYEGECMLLKLGPWSLKIPENWLLGHTTIEEWALSDGRFEMDFRLTHPWWGQIFRYAGQFDTRTQN